MLNVLKKLYPHAGISGDRILADILDDFLDMSISVSEDCLNLSVDTPRVPSDNQTNLLPGENWFRVE